MQFVLFGICLNQLALLDGQSLVSLQRNLFFEVFTNVLCCVQSVDRHFPCGQLQLHFLWHLHSQ
jgi:hypothetical protein